MKKLLLTLGVVLLVAGTVALLAGGMWSFASRHTLDGPAGLYATQRRHMCICLAGGAVLTAGGAVCLALRGRR